MASRLPTRSSLNLCPNPKVRVAATSTQTEDLGLEPESPSVVALRRFVLDLYADSILAATDVAELAWLLQEVQIPGFDNLAMHPRNLHNAARRVQAATGLQEYQASLQQIKVPVCEDNQRLVASRPVTLIHELLAEEFRRDPEGILASVSELRTKNWLDNELRLSAERVGDLAVPCGIFADAAAWRGKGAGTRDSVLSYFVSLVGLPRATRHTICTARNNICVDYLATAHAVAGARQMPSTTL